MTLAIDLVKYEAPSVNATKDAINKQFAGHSLKIAQNILANGSWLAPMPWYVGTVQNHLSVISSHVNGAKNVDSYRESILQYKNDQDGLDITIDNIEEGVLGDWMEELHETVGKALVIDGIFKAVAGLFALGFIVTLLPINAIPLSASAIAGKAFGVAAVAYAARSAWNIAYPPGKELAERVQGLLTKQEFWEKSPRVVTSFVCPRG